MKIAPLLIITFIGLASLMMQWSNNRYLQHQINEARSPENQSLSPQIQTAANRLISSTKTIKLRQQLEDYLTALEDGERNHTVSELLKILADTTAAELSTLIKEMQDHQGTDSNQQRRYSSLLPTLKLFRAELAPLDALESGSRLDVFAALSRQSPAKALGWLESASLPEKEHQRFLKRFHKIQVLNDPANHLDYWPEDHSFNTSPVPVIGPAEINDLLPKITEPENADIRQSLITSVLASSLLEDEGLARSRIESLGLETEEIISSLGASEDFACREILDWAIDLGGGTPEKALDLPEGLMATFAQRDLNAAADWLDEFQGHPAVKDQLTARYAMVLGATDPEAAQTWIAKIQDEKERNSVSRHTLYQWKEDDPRSFAEWQKRQSAK